MESKGNLPLVSGDGWRPSSLMVWDSPLEILHSAFMYLVVAICAHGHHASSSNRGRGGAGADEGLATKGESHPKPRYRRATHSHAASQPPRPEKTPRVPGEGPCAASHRTRERELHRLTVVAAAQEANVRVSGTEPGRVVSTGRWERVSWFLLHLFPHSLVFSNNTWQSEAPDLLIRDVVSLLQFCNSPKLITDK